MTDLLGDPPSPGDDAGVSRRRLMFASVLAAALGPIVADQILGPTAAYAAETLNNPFAGWPVTGSWEDHASYSAGGTDYPLSYNTALPAPASGTLEYRGWVDSGGRRSVLWLDTPFNRVLPKSGTLMNGSSYEANGPIVGVVFQHQASVRPNGHYGQGAIVGYSGASASPGDGDYGGDIHLHIHGVDAAGNRVDFTKFVGSTTQPEIIKSKDGNMYLIWSTGGTGYLALPGKGLVGISSMQHYNLLKRVINSDQTAGQPEVFNATEIAWINSYLSGVKP
ncbi:hypothetical protein HDA40_002687 [Hamadaea flava]|uniref:Uncharacterized protein n=1 Tax=Hamadaea flava TaxID=1742688 RepID=A0ABV8LMM4_9ACTN|nr:hypothetical protein [Hamadaea flava]MCP2324180.1 hypothetical protein [Hamadaea flava]